MIIKLITTIICLVLLAFFTGFNLDNKCDVNLLFHTFQNVPVFFTIIFSFVAGIIFTLPFALFHKAKRTKKNEKKETSKKSKTSDEEKQQNISVETEQQNTIETSSEDAQKDNQNIENTPTENE